MNGEASATKDASPTPTSMRQTARLQKPIARPQPATASVQTPSPMPIRRNALAYLRLQRECDSVALQAGQARGVSSVPRTVDESYN